MLLDALKPLRVRTGQAEIRLVPGAPVDVPDEVATWLLDQKKVRQVSIGPGCLVWWRSLDGQDRGPALVQGTLSDHGQLWVWFAFEAIEYLMHVRQVVRVHAPL